MPGDESMLEITSAVIQQGDFSLYAERLFIEEGARVAVLGPSGAGKSTLIMAIAGFIPLSKGRMQWHGTDITHLNPSDRPCATLFQDNNLFPHLSIEQNVGLALRITTRLSATERRTVDAALARVGLNGFGARKPSELSGGQQSRAALARVLLQKKPVLLLDEPFSALGPALKREMLDLVSQLCTETNASLLMISHDPEDALRICPQTILIAQGNARPAEPTQTLLDNPPPELHAYLG